MMAAKKEVLVPCYYTGSSKHIFSKHPQSGSKYAK